LAKGLGLQKNFRLAPRWLANIILTGISLMTGKQLGKEILAPAYATFSYDHSKSLELDGFSYRSIEETIREISAIYNSRDESFSLEKRMK
jgi:hypothetical protein